MRLRNYLVVMFLVSMSCLSVCYADSVAICKANGNEYRYVCKYDTCAWGSALWVSPKDFTYGDNSNACVKNGEVYGQRRGEGLNEDCNKRFHGSVSGYFADSNLKHKLHNKRFRFC